MSLSSITQSLSTARVTTFGHFWKFTLPGQPLAFLSLSPANINDKRGLVGLLKTPSATTFVKFNSPYDLYLVTQEGLRLFQTALNRTIASVEGELLLVGNTVRLARMRTGQYVLALDQTPICRVHVGQESGLPIIGKRRKTYRANAYLDISDAHLYALTEEVNGYNGIFLGCPSETTEACA